MNNRGFTLIEMLVSVAIFTSVMVIALGALLALSEANRKAELLSSATNNFNAAVDSMSRAMRTGTNYHSGSTGTITSPQDSPASGDTQFSFFSATGNEVTYAYATGGSCQNGLGCILRKIDNGPNLSITSPDIIITSLRYYAKGTSVGDSLQPRVIILISGYIVVKGTQQSVFNLQTSVTQRFYDI